MAKEGEVMNNDGIEIITQDGVCNAQQISDRLTENMERTVLLLYGFASGRSTVRILVTNMGMSQRESISITDALCAIGLVYYPSFGTVALTEIGRLSGEYLILRQRLSTSLLTFINGRAPDEREIKKVSRALCCTTVKNLERFIESYEIILSH